MFAEISVLVTAALLSVLLLSRNTSGSQSKA